MDWYEFEVRHTDGSLCASAGGADREAAFREALHYAAVYSQDGATEIIEVDSPFDEALPE